ncbi:ATP-binding protein [Marinobacter sp. CA1]|uniref:sensor histidine kinase n=1 Tax=Marinobacter sp. CA1 TaxID=2817656 RepID=UPI001D0991AC|nr:ATP-binding protein [Marinobacter sp. CA1]UDL05340.1 CHASE domain-containing protein [Marinobacter sp. CA1]
MNRILWAARACVVVVTLAGVIVLDRLNYLAFVDQQRLDVARQASLLRAQLDGTISENIQTVRGLVAMVATEPELDQQRFADIAGIVLSQRSELRNIGAAPDMVIRLMFPVEGNEAAIGLDYRANREQWPKVRQAAESGHLVLAGPIDLVQGGKGFIGRVPVFVPGPGTEPDRLWGLISAVIDRDRLYQAAGFSDASGLDLALRRLGVGGEPGAVIHGDAAVFQQHPVMLTVPIPGGQWQLAAVPSGGWPDRADNAAAFRSLLAVAAALILLPGLWLTVSLGRERASQHRLQALFELAPLGMALVDAEDGRFLGINPALYSMTGYAEGSLGTLGVATLLGPQRPWQSQRQRFGPEEFQCRRHDGSGLSVLLAGAMVKDSDGGTLVWLVFQDISEQKRVARMKTEFVSTISHELRTPLTSISGALKLMAAGKTGDLPESAQSLVTMAMRNSERLTRLINDLLDMDKLVAGKMSFEIDVQSVSELLATALDNVATYACEQQVQLTSRFHGEVWVKVDEHRFLQVMDNLLSNAIKFSPPGECVRVVVDVRNEAVTISVSDRGPGIPQSFQGRLFEKFSQADSSDRRAKGGTGLGLAIARGLLEGMEGSIHFDTSPQGTSFYITLPRADAPATVAQT